MDDRALGPRLEADLIMASQELDEVRPQRRRHEWYKRRDVLFIFVAIFIWIAWSGYGHFTAPGRMTEAVAAALAQNPETIDLLVTAKFPPERFHSNIYNELGSQRGTEGATTKLAFVTPSNANWLARQYWIKKIDLMPGK